MIEGFNSGKSLHDEMQARENTFIRLFGIHVGQFPDSIQVTKGRKKAIRENDDLVHNKDWIQFPSSMTLVVPAERIFDLLQTNALAKQRLSREWTESQDKNQSTEA